VIKIEYGTDEEFNPEMEIMEHFNYNCQDIEEE